MVLPISEIETTTIEARARKSVNNISNNNALLSHMKKSNGGKLRMKPFTGGSELTEAVTIDETIRGFYRGNQRMNTSGKPVSTMAKMPLVLAYAQVSITGEDELKNDGRAAMINLFGMRTEAGVWSLENMIAASLYSNGDGLNLYGLSYYLKQAQTGSTAGLDRTEIERWRNNVVTGLTTTGETTNVNEKINQAITNVRISNMGPDCGFADNNAWLALVREAQLQQRFGDGGSASMGFKSLNVSGADIYPDGGLNGHAPANTIFMLNSRNVHYRPSPKRHFSVAKKDKEPHDQDVRIRYVYFAGQLTMDSLRNHSLITA